MKHAVTVCSVWLALGIGANALLFGVEQSVVFLGISAAVLLDLWALWSLGRILLDHVARPGLLVFLVSLKVFALAFVGIAVWYFNHQWGAKPWPLFMASLTIVVVPTALVRLGNGHGS